MREGYTIESLYTLQPCKRRRISSYDTTGGNHDWKDIRRGEVLSVAEISGNGIIRHIWCTYSCIDEHGNQEHAALRKLIIRMYWDDETSPSVEAPLGDFFGMGFGQTKVYYSAALSMNPQDGRAMNCYFPMPFRSNARITLENLCDDDVFFYYYIDYETDVTINEDSGYFHASFNRERNTRGWAPKEPGLFEREKANDPSHPDWYPAVWMRSNTSGEDNYTILEAEGEGKYVGCNLSIDVFEPQCNLWYGEGDDMIFIDGTSWPPELHGTGTEDYFNTAFCPKQEYSHPDSGITLYSGEQAGFPWGGKNCMYRLHIQDPIHFKRSIRVSIEHGHANKLSNDYSSTAYWYQKEPHIPFVMNLTLENLIPRINPWEQEGRRMSHISTCMIHASCIRNAIRELGEASVFSLVAGFSDMGIATVLINDAKTPEVSNPAFSGILQECVADESTIIIADDPMQILQAESLGCRIIGIGKAVDLYRAHWVVPTFSEIGVDRVKKRFLVKEK